MTRFRICMNSIANPSAYAKEQWFALGLCAVCYGVDIWAAYSTWGEQNPVRDPHSIFIWVPEVALATVATVLLYFAFSQRPKENTA